MHSKTHRPLAENMKLRSSLILALKEHIAKEGLTQSEAAKKFGVTQPRISDLLRGKIDLFDIDHPGQHASHRREFQSNYVSGKAA